MPFPKKTARFGLSALMAVMVLAAQASAQEDPDPARGKRVYRGTCIACHGPTGKGGIPGTPDFTKGNGVLSQDDSVLTDHIRNGFRSKGSRDRRRKPVNPVRLSLLVLRRDDWQRPVGHGRKLDLIDPDQLSHRDEEAERYGRCRHHGSEKPPVRS